MFIVSIRIPRLKETVEQLLASCLQELRTLPPRPTMDSAAELIQLSGNFCTAVIAMVKGSSEDKSFVHRSREHYDTLKLDILATAPDFRPFEKSVQEYDDGIGMSVMETVSADPSSTRTTSENSEQEGKKTILNLLDVRKIIKE